MDSLTQLTLGAAVGEAVLGRKVGNRAMVWGGFAGLLPDFDVFARFFTDEISALAFHRGATHSIVFAVFTGIALGSLAEWLYRSGTYRKKWYKGLVASFILSMFGFLVFGLYWILKLPNILIGGAVAGLGLGWFVWTKYLSKNLQEVNANRHEWIGLFFLAIVTHPILDCFTAYGTRLLWPFSHVRISWDNISVVDPAYTLPLLLGVIVASFFSKNNKKRKIANWAGILISSAYMVFTFCHKNQFNNIFEKSLARQGIEYTRYMTAPTILQNFLWLGVAESDTAFYHGYYSFFNKKPIIKKFNVLPKNHQRIAHLENKREIKILKWFSKNYYNIIVRNDGRLQFNDLRYGSFNEDFKNENDYIFKFILTQHNDQLQVDQSRAGRKVDGKAFKKYFDRVLGN
ncbi:MAG TPA: metal-dependent hydrolase [Bacteroidetes bacterium]|nr:metal-dependent hydrolase [Bacteroidota bacterium]